LKEKHSKNIENKMNTSELLDIISKGETSKVQFKANVTNEQSIAQEMVAFVNTKGGTILIGVDDKTWDIIGLTDDDLRRLHRDYFINDSIKIFVFDNRIEIISPGKLPNSLTEEQVRRGVRRTRNTIIASFAPDILEYRGAGSGILRALQEYPSIDFKNDIEGEQFKVIIPRPEKK
jgi:predicted HTH transcriptional regulator